MDRCFVFIDNSNLFIEAKRIARTQYAYDSEQVFRLRIDFGKLLEIIKEKRTLGAAILVGSRPPENDTLWSTLKKLGLEPRIFDRSVHTGREKGVDSEAINAIRDTLEENPTPGTIALVAGDGDYTSTLERCLKKGWRVEVYFWSNASTALKRLPGSKFIEMDRFLPKISFEAKGLGGADRVSEGLETEPQEAY
ncbi:MAG: NYN domain-containing protein [Elusimicrobia bacterium]|nr:NYN domain-containing protein [Elusimicrobiota bacterium]